MIPPYGLRSGGPLVAYSVVPATASRCDVSRAVQAKRRRTSRRLVAPLPKRPTKAWRRTRLHQHTFAGPQIGLMIIRDAARVDIGPARADAGQNARLGDSL